MQDKLNKKSSKQKPFSPAVLSNKPIESDLKEPEIDRESTKALLKEASERIDELKSAKKKGNSCTWC